jgi:hypothetical protein
VRRAVRSPVGAGRTLPPMTRTRSASRPRHYSTDYRLDWLEFLDSRPESVADELRRLLDATEGDEGDEQLAAIVAEAGNSQDAARLVLVRVLPGLLSAAGRRAQLDHRPPADVLHDVVANAWIIIRNYPIDRRPRRIAANIVRDSEYQTFVRHKRLRSAGETPTIDLQEFPGPDTEVHPSFEVVETLAEARRCGVDPAALEVLARLALTDVSLCAMADEQCVTVRTLLKRRRAAEEAVAAAVGHR